MEELLDLIDKHTHELRCLSYLIPERFGSRRSEIGTMIQAILDRTYQLRIELLKVREGSNQTPPETAEPHEAVTSREPSEDPK